MAARRPTRRKPIRRRIILGVVVLAVLGWAGMALAVMIPCALFLSMLRYCSFYPSYVEVFGKPALPPQD